MSFSGATFDDESRSTSTYTRLRFLQFRLRTLFATTFVVAVMCLVLANWLSEILSQERATEWLNENGFIATPDYSDYSRIGALEHVHYSSPPAWFLKLIGRSEYQTTLCVVESPNLAGNGNRGMLNDDQRLELYKVAAAQIKKLSDIRKLDVSVALLSTPEMQSTVAELPHLENVRVFASINRDSSDYQWNWISRLHHLKSLWLDEIVVNKTMCDAIISLKTIDRLIFTNVHISAEDWGRVEDDCDTALKAGRAYIHNANFYRSSPEVIINKSDN